MYFTEPVHQLHQVVEPHLSVLEHLAQLRLLREELLARRLLGVAAPTAASGLPFAVVVGARGRVVVAGQLIVEAVPTLSLASTAASGLRRALQLDKHHLIQQHGTSLICKMTVRMLP